MNTELRHGLFVVDEDGRILSEVQEIGLAQNDGTILTKKRERIYEPHFALTKVPKELWHKTRIIPRTITLGKKESKKLWDLQPPNRMGIFCPTCGNKYPKSYFYKSTTTKKMMVSVECNKCGYKNKRPC